MSMAEKRYGVWDGNAEGYACNPKLCIQEVFPRPALIPLQCARKRGHGPEGAYCKKHAAEKEKLS